VSAIELAIQGAVDSCDATRGRSIQELRLAEAWIGLAGGDREAIGSRIRVEVARFLGQRPDMMLSVTNDIQLLATASSHQFKSDDVIVLVAGTGSIAMRYWQEGNVVRRVARAGGWGALLGDDGSGFDIGRKAIRTALYQAEEQLNSHPTNGNTLDPLAEIVFQHFQPVGAKAGDVDLLNKVLLSGSGAEQSVSQTKQKIAGCAKAVIGAVTTSKRAECIVSDAVDSLVCLVRTVSKTASSGASKPFLILAGGLMSSDLVRHHLENRLGKEGLRFSSTEQVRNSASMGAQFLAEKAWHQCRDA
jgi:N-acetylmuramic acid 6-phosphate etherase